MSTTLHPTAQALRLHRSHLATSHRTPLAPRPQGAARRRATSFTPMARASHVETLGPRPETHEG